MGYPTDAPSIFYKAQLGISNPERVTMNSATSNNGLQDNGNFGIPRGFGYALGTLIAVLSFIGIGILLGNIPLGMAWFASGYAVGFTLEGENQKPFSLKQKRLAASSVISGGISLVASLFLFNVVLF